MRDAQRLGGNNQDDVKHPTRGNPKPTNAPPDPRHPTPTLGDFVATLVFFAMDVAETGRKTARHGGKNMQPPKSVHAADTRRPRNPPDAPHPRQQAQDLSKRPNLSKPFFPLSRRTQGNHRPDKNTQDNEKREMRKRTNPPRRPRHPAEPARGRPDTDERS